MTRGFTDNARYAKLGWQVGKVHFYVLEVRNRLGQCWNADIIGKCQDLSLSVLGVKKIHEIFHANLRLVKSRPELSLRTKILLVLRGVRDIGDLPQCSADCHNDVAPFGYGAGERTGLCFRNELCDVICHAQPRKVCTINDWETSRRKAFNLQVRSKRTGRYIRDVITEPAFC